MTKQPSKRTLTALLGLAVFLTLSVPCSLLIVLGTGGPGALAAALTLLLGGILMLLILQRYRKYRYRPGPALLAVVIGCAGALLAVLGVLTFGLAWADVNPATYTYRVTVTGLDNYTGGPVTDILVPLPLREGKMIFSEEDLEGQRVGAWKTLFAETPKGRMLVFQTMERDLSDISVTFGSPVEKYFLIDDITRESFSPVVTEAPAGYTRWAFGTGDVQNFTTLVRLDEGIRPKTADAGPIVIHLWITAGGGRLHGITGEKYQVEVYEAIPPGVTGFVPVRAQVARFGDVGIVPVRE